MSFDMTALNIDRVLGSGVLYNSVLDHIIMFPEVPTDCYWSATIALNGSFVVDNIPIGK